MMFTGRVAWLMAAYLAGTFPGAWLVAKLTRARTVQARTGRRAGETDPHVLMTKDLGWGWAAVAAGADVVKAALVVLAARYIGDLPDAWLAAAGVAAVLGHAFPFYLRRWAGRGLAAGAGALLVLLPLEMTIAGAMILFGFALRSTGLLSTVAIGSVPIVAAVRHQPEAFVWMAVAIFVILIARRLEGVADVVRGGVPWSRAVLWRAVLDATAPAVPKHDASSG
jgi:acyl phosphate:glycerol-3-phosphate acyltransferase